MRSSEATVIAAAATMPYFGTSTRFRATLKASAVTLSHRVLS